MKKKVLLFLIMGLSLVSIGMGVILSLSDDSKKNNEKNEIKEDQKEKVKPKYDSSLLEIFDEYDFEEVNGSIKDFGYDIAVTQDNKIYLLHGDYVMQLDDSFENIVDNSTSHSALETLLKLKDGNYSLFGRNSKDDGGIKFTLALDNVIYATDYNKYVYTLEEGYLYKYDVVDNKVSEEKTKLYLNIAESTLDNVSLYDGKVDFLGIITSTSEIFFKLEDGTIRSFNVHCDFFDDAPYLAPRDSASEYEHLKEPEEIYGISSILSYLLPYYSIKNDNNNIYLSYELGSGISQDEYYDCIDSKSSTECISKHKITITLPEEYNISNIKKIYNFTIEAEQILVVMDDSKIYSYNGSDWKEVEELSKLNKDNHIKKISVVSNNLLILCDDNYIYEVKDYNLF